jgi:ABC-2 type transport system permease protein
MIKGFILDSWWIAWRELKHFAGQKVRVLLLLVQPFVWLVLMGNLFARVAAVPGFPAPSYLDYMTAGIIVMVSLSGGIFGGISVVWDRRLGFLYKLMAAPISRGSIVAGKMLAIGLQTVFQVTVIFLLARIMGVGFAAGPEGLALLLVLALLLSQVFSGLSLALGAVITSHEALVAVTNFLTLPLIFTSEAMMPRTFMPEWLAGVAAYNPLSYAVGPMRHLFLKGIAWELVGRGMVVLAALALGFGFLATQLFKQG